MRDKQDFLNKAYTYQLYFNLIRKNSYKDWKSPKDILQEYGLPEEILILPPIIIDNLVKSIGTEILDLHPKQNIINFIYEKKLSYHVPDYPNSPWNFYANIFIIC